MKVAPRAFALLLLSTSITACASGGGDDDDSNPPDAAVVIDGGGDVFDAAFDAAVVDGPVDEIDAAGPPDGAVADAALEVDAEVSPADAAEPDAASPPDAATTGDGATGLGMFFIGSTATAQFGNLTGGTAYEDVCPAGEALIGFAGALTSGTGYHGQIAAVCGLVHVAPDLAVTVTTGTTLPTRGIQGATAWTRTCPTDQVVVGFRGRSGSLIDQLTFRCAPLTVAADGSGYVVTVGASSDLAAIGGNGGNAFNQTDCATGQVAATARIRAGDGIDAFGLACSTPTVQ